MSPNEYVHVVKTQHPEPFGITGTGGPLMHKIRTTIAIALGAVLVSDASAAFAAPPMRQRAVDVFSLKDGTRLLGVAVTPEDHDPTRVLLSVTWLRETYPKLYDQLVFDSAAASNAESTDLEKRLTAHIQNLEKSSPDQIERIGHLRERLQDLKPEHEDPGDFDLVLLNIPSALIRREFRQKPSVRQTGGLAILNGIENAEMQTTEQLNAALTALGTTTRIQTELPNDPVANAGNEAEDQEFLRILAVTENQFGKRCQLVHHGGQYLSADRQAIDLQTLLPQLLQGQLQSQIQELLAETAGAPQSQVAPAQPNHTVAPVTKLDPRAARIAEADECRLVEISEMQLDAQRGFAAVQIKLYFKDPENSQWTLIARVEETARTADVSPEQIAEISNDPNVKQVLNIFGTLGSGSGNISNALAIGGVVQIAQGRAKAKLSRHLSNGGAQKTSPSRILRAILKPESTANHAPARP